MRSPFVRNRRQIVRPISHAVTASLEMLERRIQMDATYTQISTAPLFQNWTNTGLITSNNNWSGVPSIQGFIGTGLASGTGKDPQTVLGESTTLNVNANHADPDTFTTGGVTEFDGISNPVVAIKGTATANAPYVQFNVDTTGVTQVEVKYNLSDVGGAHTAAKAPAALQYRVGETGNFINVPAGNAANVVGSSGTPIDAILPAGAVGQAKVQIRVITADAVGSDEWIGVDDIYVGDGRAVTPAVQFNVTNYNVFENAGNATISVYRIGDLSNSATVNYATSDGSAVAGSDYTTTSGTVTSKSGPGWGDIYRPDHR